MFADSRRRIARIAPLPRPGVAAVDGDGAAVVSPNLPRSADFHRAAPLIIDEGVFSVLPIRLQPNRQGVAYSIFGEQAEGRITALGRQGNLLTRRIEARIAPLLFIFDDRLPLALGRVPGPRLRQGRPGERQTPRRCGQAS